MIPHSWYFKYDFCFNNHWGFFVFVFFFFRKIDQMFQQNKFFFKCLIHMHIWTCIYVHWIWTEKKIQCLYFRLKNPGKWRTWNSQNFLSYRSNITYFKKSTKFLFLFQISPNFAHLFSVEDNNNICIMDQILWNSQNTSIYWEVHQLKIESAGV
jgi:hypothetical protein